MSKQMQINSGASIFICTYCLSEFICRKLYGFASIFFKFRTDIRKTGSKRLKWKNSDRCMIETTYQPDYHKKEVYLLAHAVFSRLTIE